MSLHPNSLANLRPIKGSKPRYEKCKKKRNITVTEDAWIEAKRSIKEELKISVSEMVELVGRGELKVTRVAE